VPICEARPLLKWAGGKRQLLTVLRDFYPERFTRYIEPFFGSGAVFFDLYRAGRLDGRRARLVDANPDLVGCYTMLRDRTAEVIGALEALAAAHRARGDAFYYEVRDARFNPARAGAPGVYTPELAAMLVYLNRTGFNGLFRLNRRGEFNVPAGRYESPRICDREHLETVAAALGARGVTIERASFEAPLADAGDGDFVYCDPPYAPLSATSSFAHYTASGFDAGDQRRLRDAVVAAARRGAQVVVSNSSAPLIESLYTEAAARRAGLRLGRVAARRAINSRASARGAVDEVIVTNVNPAALKRCATVATLAAMRPRMARAALRTRAIKSA
jgi:DNA adenine methylase